MWDLWRLQFSSKDLDSFHGFYFSHPQAPYRCWSLPLWIPKETFYKYHHYLVTGMTLTSFSKISVTSVKMYAGHKGSETPVTHRGSKGQTEGSGIPWGLSLLLVLPSPRLTATSCSNYTEVTRHLHSIDRTEVEVGRRLRPIAGRVLASGNDSREGGRSMTLEETVANLPSALCSLQGDN